MPSRYRPTKQEIAEARARYIAQQIWIMRYERQRFGTDAAQLFRMVRYSGKQGRRLPLAVVRDIVAQAMRDE